MLRRVARYLATPQSIPTEFQAERLDGEYDVAWDQPAAVWAPAWLYL